ncbi:hypothetical protein [Acuticoccus sp. I52.16.1]|uniref:hypothetical protein n=1 Tax=Acuticoccus sp. I52.16.1 TaxID=2928472 RepID=UPI001FD22386|nr:hypothetical protein [Acuticoccus sp. I52.16.1]UOM32860.1 hypothetical protein MRB58_13350 [Acuticoccus sp. I52.16.1]
MKMRSFGILLGAAAFAFSVQFAPAQAQDLTGEEISFEVASLKQDLEVLPTSFTPKSILNDIRDQVGSIVTASFESYMTYLRRSFNPTRNVFENETNIFDYARNLGYTPRGNSLLGALFRPDFEDPALTRDERGRVRGFVRQRLIEIGANQYRINFVLRKIYNLRNPNDGPLNPAPPVSPS